MPSAPWQPLIPEGDCPLLAIVAFIHDLSFHPANPVT